MKRNEMSLAKVGCAALLSFLGTACSDAEGPGRLERSGANVEVTAAYQECKTDQDCVLVNVTCNSCCERDAITSTLSEAFEDEKKLACSDYEGGECDCSEQPLNALCTKGLCRAQDTCELLVGSYESEEKAECGIGEDGVNLCHWTLDFKSDGKFDWMHSDVGESGTYACERGRIKTENPYYGAVHEDGSVTFDGVEYHRN